MSTQHTYDLADRTKAFGRSAIAYCKTVRLDAVTRPLISQLVRSATSVGANYAEANAASSRKDFRNKIHICKKEAQETAYWLEMMKECNGGDVRKLEQEVEELIKIFGKILSTMKNHEATH